MLTSAQARELAEAHLGSLGDRWEHIKAVGRLADSLVEAKLIAPVLSPAAWLHDVGYSPDLIDTGFHPLDGARFLEGMAAPATLVGLVAHHTGAVFEAEERGLAQELAALPTPPSDLLDALTLVDLCTGPTGTPMTPTRRLDEIRSRYAASHPVFRAVDRSGPHLLDAAAKARARLGLSDDWPVEPT